MEISPASSPAHYRHVSSCNAFCLICKDFLLLRPRTCQCLNSHFVAGRYVRRYCIASDSPAAARNQITKPQQEYFHLSKLYWVVSTDIMSYVILDSWHDRLETEIQNFIFNHHQFLSSLSKHYRHYPSSSGIKTINNKGWFWSEINVSFN